MKNFPKDFVYILLEKLFKFLYIFIPIDVKRVTFVRRTRSGSNVVSVYKKVKQFYPDVNAELIADFEANSKVDWIKQKFTLYKKLLRSKIVVTTHGVLLKTPKNITIDLWHAFPTKKSGLMLDEDSCRSIAQNTDYFLSYSDFSTLLLNSRYGMKYSNYVVLGSPRNDYLFKEKKEIPNFLKNFENHKVIFFLPTFREYKRDDLKERQKLRFKDFDFEKFNNFLKKNKYVFVTKFHPNDKELWLKALKDIKYSNVVILEDRDIEDRFEDFYEVLPFSDMLITDYSSVYVDYLLLNKPMIFVPIDLDEYNKDRGLLLNPYNFWRPGPKCVTQQSLEKEIVRCLNDVDYFKEERQTIRKLFHEYEDGQSTQRVAEFIYSKLNQK